MTPYEIYMLDFMKENRINEMEYMKIKPYEEESEEDKNPVYKINYVMRDNLQIPKITDVLAKKRVQDEIIQFTGNYMDTHSKQLMTAGPVHMLTFGAKETKFLYDIFNTSAEELIELYKKMVEETYYGKISKFITGFVMNAPHKLLLTAILIDATQHDYPDIVECMEYLWAFSEYPILYREYWKTGVKEDVMNYTIEHLGTKFKITKMKNLQEFLKYNTTMAVNSMPDKLKLGADNVYIDLMQSIRNRLNSALKNISRAYYKNNDSNKTQHQDTTIADDGNIIDNEGSMANVSQVIDRIINKFMNGEINASLVKIASDMTKVDNSNLAGFIGQIYASKKNRIPEFIETLIMSYFEKNPTSQSLESTLFLNFGFSVYKSIGTSNDPNYIKLKAIMNFWMNDIINIKEFYNRPATIISYTRAIFNYMVMMINFFA